MFDKLFGHPESPKRADPFGLRPICLELGLGKYLPVLQKVCRPSVAIEHAAIRPDLPHTASRLGGFPALPDRFAWPVNCDGEPLRFLGQLTCAELDLAKLEGLPEEGLISIFLDRFDDEPSFAEVFHFSLKRDLLRRAPPAGASSDCPAIRPVFRTIPSFPHPRSAAFQNLELDEGDVDAYEEFLIELEHSLDPYQLRCGGHAPQGDIDPEFLEPADPAWEFFLAVRDIEELEILWPESGCSVIWLPNGPTRFADGRAEVTWQAVDEEWNEEDDTEETDDDDESEEQDQD